MCACPTTEADLGDGIIPAGELVRGGVRLALGRDSNAVVDLVQEARLLEMHERLRTRARLCLAGSDGQVGRALLDDSGIAAFVRELIPMATLVAHMAKKPRKPSAVAKAPVPEALEQAILEVLR